jgi:hypothetical protein
MIRLWKFPVIEESLMIRSLRVVAVVVFASIVLTTTAQASVVGPELDPGSTAAGLTILGGGLMYLVERFRRR